MNSIPNPFAARQSTAQKGKLFVYPQSASIDGNVETLGKLQVFCRFHLGKGLIESVPDKKNGRHPAWSQVISFHRDDETDLIVNLYNKNLLLSPSYLCECRINLVGVFSTGQVVVTPDLVRKGNVVGSMKLLIKWEPDRAFTIVQPIQQNHFGFPQQVYVPQQMVMHGQVMNAVPIMQNGQNMMNQQGRPFSPVYMIGSMPNQGRPVLQYPQQPYQPFPPQQPHPGFMPNQSAQPVQKKEEKKQAVEEIADPNLPEDQKCVICLDRKKAGAFYKCGHSCCCVTCGTGFIGKTCPICREQVLDFIKVFDS